MRMHEMSRKSISPYLEVLENDQRTATILG